jgi:nitrile hydratase accessory protein
VTASDLKAQGSGTETVPRLGQDENGPVFREAWEAQAFALTLNLHERGVFTWPEWTAALAKEIRRSQSAVDRDTGETHYHRWLAALEEIVVAKGLTTFAMLTRFRDAWDAAARRTPHGTPIELGPQVSTPWDACVLCALGWRLMG